MQLFVMPITTKLLTTANRTMDIEFPLAKKRHIPLLPIMMERGLEVMYSERALELIKGAVEAGVPEAMEQLVTMYETGKGVARDYYEGVRWREKHVEYLRGAFKSETTGDRAVRLISSLWDLGNAQYALRMLEAAGRSINLRSGRRRG